jgi:hypothetical protein
MIDPKLEKLLVNVHEEIGKILDAALLEAEAENLDACAVFEGLGHALASRAGQLEIIHIESDLRYKTQDPSAKIDKTLLTKAIGHIQINMIKSLSMGMDEALKTGGHFTLEALKKEIVEATKKVAKNDDDSDNGKTFH